MNWQAFLYAALVISAGNFFYKKRTFEDISWVYTGSLSLWFVFCSLFLLMPAAKFIFVNYWYMPLFLVSTVVWFIWPWMIRKIGTFPKEYYKKDPSRFLVRFNEKITVIKFFEILFQQIGFLFLFFVVLKNLPLEMIIVWSVLIIGGIHIANFFFMPAKWALFYFVLSLPMSVIFPVLILKGLIFLTISIHLLFYLIHNSYYWFKK